jgi:hypothetical protein
MTAIERSFATQILYLKDSYYRNYLLGWFAILHALATGRGNTCIYLHGLVQLGSLK